MDPVTVGAVLAAIAGGAGGALGSQLWTGLAALVRQPFHSQHATEQSRRAAPSGAAELAALQRSPADGTLALALADALVARANADSGFSDALQAWWRQASQVNIRGDVTNTVSGGTFLGPVFQGRDFTGLTFGSATPPPPG
jgi:hypothetical protein